MQQERRKHPRVPVNPEFAPVLGEDEIYAQDLSERGVFLRTATELPVGSTLQVRFSVLADDVFVFNVRGRVANCRARHPRGLGIEFTELDAATRKELNRVLALSTLRNRWDEGADVSRTEWDRAQQALRGGATASEVEFAAVPSRVPEGEDDDEVTRVFYYEGADPNAKGRSPQERR